nr:hypothetical protein [Tanacetum cinerariifolium]
MAEKAVAAAVVSVKQPHQSTVMHMRDRGGAEAARVVVVSMVMMVTSMV